MYLKKITYFFAATLLVFTSCSKDEIDEVDHCSANRYDQEIFAEVSRTNVKYGAAPNLDGDNINLLMDIYQPVGDDYAKRPVMIWAFGGGFYNGSRLDMKPLAEEAARRGFVSISIDYRLINILNGFPGADEVFKIVFMGSNDMKAAIRYLRHDAANDNLYRIDPDQIFIGGASSGSILSLHAAYIGDGEELGSESKVHYDALGGYKGDSGLRSTDNFDHNVKGVINLAGAISDLNLIDAGDPPIISYHGDMDEVVPYEHANFELENIPLFELFGSKSIHDDAQTKGLSSTLYTVMGGDHGGVFEDDKFESDRAIFLGQYFDFLKDRLCE